MTNLNQISKFIKKHGIAVFVFLSLIVYVAYRNTENSLVKDEGLISIGYIDSYNTRAKSGSYVRYIYHVKGTKYINNVTIGGEIKPSYVDKYYQIKYLKDNPSKSVLYLNREVTDSVLISPLALVCNECRTE